LVLLFAAAAQSQAEAGSKARQELQALLARKQEAANKLELLQVRPCFSVHNEAICSHSIEQALPVELLQILFKQ
jgi:hypothetical protein